MKFSELAKYFKRLEQEDSRLAMTAILSELFQKVSVDEISKVVYISLGILAPKYKGIEFNMAEKMALKVISSNLGMDLVRVSDELKEIGDLGDYFYQKQKTKTASSKVGVIYVYGKLLKIALEGGIGSVERKVNKLNLLLKELDPLGAKYVLRMVVAKLRLGFSSMTILDALSWSKKGDKSLREPLERAFNTQADIGQIAKIFKEGGLAKINKIGPVPGIPIRAAKAERLKDAADILEKLEGQCLIEPKIDGFRLMLHLDKKQKQEINQENLSLFGGNEENKYLVHLFSRNLDNMTHMFPDVVTAVQRLPATSVILDSEAIAVNPQTGEFLSFQETVQRKRKYGVAKKAKEIPLKVFAFDLLYLDGKSLMEKPFMQRRRELEKLINKTKSNTILLTEQKRVNQTEEFDQFFKKVQKEGLEGLMAKKASSIYKAGIRDHNWVKYKVAMQSDLADTVDCVVMGYYKGKGKRNKFGIGAFLAGVRSGENYVTVSKIGTGLTDEQWREMYTRCQKLKTKEKPKQYKLDKNLNPDGWCEPDLVVEIEADTITKSPLHTAGLAMRFPRLKRFRDDKGVDQATSVKELVQMYKKR